MRQFHHLVIHTNTKQHKRKGKRTYPCIPNSTSTCGSSVSLGSNAGRGFAWKTSPSSLGYLCEIKNKILQHAHPPLLCLGILKSQCQIRDAWLQFLLTISTQIPQLQLSNHHHCTFKHQHTINSKPSQLNQLSHTNRTTVMIL